MRLKSLLSEDKERKFKEKEEKKRIEDKILNKKIEESLKKKIEIVKKQEKRQNGCAKRRIRK